MRVATFNVENLFSRAKAMNLESWDEGREVLNDVQALNNVIAKETYTGEDKTEILKILKKYRFDERDVVSRPFDVIQVRERLFSLRNTGVLDVVADGRAEWVGWVELAREKINGTAIYNTGRVIAEVGADIQCMVEVENRIVLQRFDEQVLGESFNIHYPHHMLIDGNDARGIDVGLMSRFPIVSLRSHVDDRIEDHGVEVPIFSRDCTEFELALPGGDALWLLVNHFKSKGYGSVADNNRKRKRQAQRVAQIYAEARQRADHVIVAGDLNDTPDSDPLEPLAKDTDLRDVMSHPLYVGKPGTYETGNTPRQKIDYLLLSPKLWDMVTAVGVERRGIWAPNTFKSFDTVKRRAHSASDHAAVWVDLELG